MDKQNRLRISERRVKEARLGKEITLVGVRDHLQVWPRDEWDVYNRMLRARGSEIAMRARQAEMQHRAKDVSPV